MTPDANPPKERTYAGLTRPERDEQRRRRLLAAGLEAFGTVGFPATSVEAICAAAGVSTRSFYDYYAGREGLLVAVYDETIEGARQATIDALATLPAGASAHDQAQAGLSAFTHAILGDVRRARVNFIEVVGASPEVERHRRATMQSFATLLLEIAKALQAAGLLGPRAEHELQIGTTALVGAVQETLLDWISRPDRLPIDIVVEDLTLVFSLVAAVGEREG